MPKRLPNNVVDLRTGKPLEPARKKAAKTAKVVRTAEVASADGAEKHNWEFKPRFRRGAFGWRSEPAITRIKEAISEIKKVSRKEPALAAEGAVIFLERLSPALEKVDSSSGAIGSAVNDAIEFLASIIAAAVVAVENTQYEQWLERLWQAHEADKIPYLEAIGDYWGEFCATTEIASRWADKFIPAVRLKWSGGGVGADFHGTSACLSALLQAGRYDELLELLSHEPYKMWQEHQFGARALANMGKISEAIEYAKVCAEKHSGYSPWIAGSCEEMLLKAGRVKEAYEHYSLLTNRQSSYLGTYRAIAKKYPSIERKQILTDLIEKTPGEEGKWFAAAKELKLFDLAVELARKGPCEPKTLTKAACDYGESNPAFALETGLCSLNWLFQGYGYEVTSADILAAYGATMKAAEVLGKAEAVRGLIAEAVKRGLAEGRWAAGVLAREFKLK
jgi:hypothetical protein